MSINMRSVKIISLSLLIIWCTSCSKTKTDKNDPGPDGSSKKIVYTVTGTHFKLNYIDSNSVFHNGEIHDGTFRYEFNKGSGAYIGISIFVLQPSDHIDSWTIHIDNKLVANAFSEGGAYFTVPYH